MNTASISKGFAVLFECLGYLAIGLTCNFLYYGHMLAAFLLTLFALFFFGLGIKAVRLQAHRLLGEIGVATGKFFRFATPHAVRAGSVATTATSKVAHASAAKFLTETSFCLSWGFGVVTLFLFVSAYTLGQWGRFHLGFVTLLATAMSVIVCNRWQKVVLNFLLAHALWVWLTISVMVFALSFGHNWSNKALIISGFSTLCAIITVAKGWGRAGNLALASLKWGGKLYTGKYGYDVALFVIAATLLAIALMMPALGLPAMLLAIGSFIIAALLFFQNRLVNKNN